METESQGCVKGWGVVSGPFHIIHKRMCARLDESNATTASKGPIVAPPDGDTGGMNKQVTCECGAIYERTEEKLTFRDSDSFACRCCGATVETWNGSRIPVFRLIKEPEAKASG
jgi:hypothetical protein